MADVNNKHLSKMISFFGEKTLVSGGWQHTQSVLPPKKSVTVVNYGLCWKYIQKLSAIAIQPLIATLCGWKFQDGHIKGITHYNTSAQKRGMAILKDG